MQSSSSSLDSNQVDEEKAGAKETDDVTGDDQHLDMTDSSRMAEPIKQNDFSSDVKVQSVHVKEEILEQSDEMEPSNVSDENNTARTDDINLEPVESTHVPKSTAAVEADCAGDAAKDATAETNAATPAVVKEEEQPVSEDATVVRNASPALVKQEEKEAKAEDAAQDAPAPTVKVEKDASHTEPPAAPQAAPEASLAQYSPRAKEAHERIRRNKCVPTPIITVQPRIAVGGNLPPSKGRMTVFLHTAASSDARTAEAAPHSRLAA
jgi:hypothetical protein